MKLLQKILFIAMIVVLSWNANIHGMHPVLDFNGIAVGNVPSCLISKIYTHGVPPQSVWR